MEPALGPSAGAALATVREHWDATGLGPEFRALGDDLAYDEFARHVLDIAAERARSVQVGDLPYQPDAAFTADEARVVHRALATGLWMDRPWAHSATVAGLLADSAVAPTAAKTVPSQSICFAISRAVRDAPTPESIALLQEAVPAIRHAGVRKKLQKDIQTARRTLSARPEVALRTPIDGELSKTQLNAWIRALEACWMTRPEWSVATWQRLMFSTDQTARVASRLIWILDDGRTFIGAPDAFSDVDGTSVFPGDDGTVRLWHPVTATSDERAAWRAHLWAHKIDQPFRQAFREHYSPADHGFAPMIVEVKQFMGVARSQGWSTGPDGLARDVEGLRCEVRTDNPLYPGLYGDIGVREVVLGRAEPVLGDRDAVIDTRLVDSDELPPVPASEMLRSVDLILSTSGVALESTTDSRASVTMTAHGVLALRAEILSHVVGEINSGSGPQPRVEGRFIEVGDTRVHLATARVTRNGDPVEIEARQRTRMWMPVEDPLIARIVGLVATLTSSQ
ncbi:DUF4132 domain-containing protein [Branchiibius sp. NY16-3462-2]|uniref:DUF4132 domain-containing protein n=1 Tax=Branchiibius sp. NY16-3462-2 TaxID=1807500 RepID=UPI00079649A2|nr:DUF4132 domain-containing protein [Branchiibius sp. NY16-3462-2]KYH46310.1 hypothetical protein AZH51_11930 [Branchiibius sp. NY16-3462-2]